MKALNPGKRGETLEEGGGRGGERTGGILKPEEGREKRDGENLRRGEGVSVHRGERAFGVGEFVDLMLY